jgi:exopolysaccharide production protein ExoQ
MARAVPPVLRAPASPPQSPRALEIWLWAIGLFLLTSPFVYQLTGLDPSQELQRDLSSMRREGSSGVLLYVIRYAVAGLAVLTVLPYWKAALGRLPRMWPPIAFALWAAFTLAWTDTFSSSLNGVLALLPLLIVGFCAGSRLPPHHFARAFVLAGACAAVFSILYAFALPKFGVHQLTDASQSVHAGAWRGVYPHKNLLGGMMACFAVVTLLSGRSVMPSAVFKWALFAVLVGIVVLSRSATALVILVTAPALVLASVAIGGKPRLLVMLTVIPMGVILAMNIGAVFELLGRDPTFTGRTSLWGLAGEAIARRPIGGYGYASTTYGDFIARLFAEFALLDPHNGYINLMLSCGFVGFALFLTGVGLFASTARQMFIDGGVRRQAALALSGIQATWLIAMLSESQDRPLGALAGIGFSSLALLLYRPSPARDVEPTIPTPGPVEALRSPKSRQTPGSIDSRGR